MRRLMLLPFIALMLIALTVPVYADGDNDDDRRDRDDERRDKKDDDRRDNDRDKDEDRDRDNDRDRDRDNDRDRDRDRNNDRDRDRDANRDNDEDRDENAAPDPWLPEGMRGFVGVLRGRVIRVFEHAVLIKVERVARGEGNEAENPRAAIRKELLINVGWVKNGERWVPNRRHVAFLGTLRRGMRVDLNVRNDEGDRLHIVELNEKQRRAVERAMEAQEREERQRRERNRDERADDDRRDDDRRDDDGGNDRRRPDRRRPNNGGGRR